VIATAVVTIFAASELYLAVYHPVDIASGVIVTVAIMVNAFRYFTPDDIFPVVYRRGKTAHVDVGGRRGEALRSAIQDQIGLTVLDVKPFGLEGSGGSTPLRIRVAGDPDVYLFGKLYTMTHVRSDRWYKLGRALLYGRLEDETRFQSVLRLVEYEDYALRLLRDSGITTAEPVGIVELTPEREYLLLTEFFDGATEIGDATVDDAIIDQGLRLIRQLWDAGLAHRDIKPANLLVRDGRLLLIDVFFVQVRPSPWRQAVDLANMMLVLAVRTDPERVYRRALELFSADEIAEAFAAARGIASPTQLRMAVKEDGRDLLARFRELAPARAPIPLQHWTPRRVAVTILAVVALVVGGAFTLVQTKSMLEPAHDVEVTGAPDCGTDNVMILMAQSVPSATSVPCVASLPTGWDLGDVHIARDEGSFSLDSDRAGNDAVRVTLLPRDECVTTGADRVPSDEVGMRRFEHIRRLPPDLDNTRYYLFEGGCVTYHFSFDAPEGAVASSLVFEADNALAFQPRGSLVREVDERNGQRLCGAGAPPCPGGSP
jgi:tRNA A-37 threonylcarbamoyl transferase component Bud32